MERGSGHWRPTRVEVDLAAIRGNVERIGELAGVPVCAVVKADGYGHGAVAVARAALAGGAWQLAVALVEEAVTLRDAGIDAPILLLSEPPRDAVDEVIAGRITPMVYREECLDAFAAAGRRADRPVGLHLKVDTGMGRVGAMPGRWPALVERAAHAAGVVVQGIATHLARADEPDAQGAAATARQLEVFDASIAVARSAGLSPRIVHAANTAGTLLHPASRHGMVRPGIGVYGLSPSTAVSAAGFGLAPALSLLSEVAFAKEVPAGTPVSYGHRWTTPEAGWIATLPIGYADGMPRAVSNRVDVLIDGRRRPLVGTVTMDQVLVWCGTDRPEVGAPVTLIGAQGSERILVEEWAAAADTITYEIVTQLTARLPRRSVDGPHTEPIRGGRR